MYKNKLKQIWAEGGMVHNGWLHIPHSFVAEIMAHAGYDSLTLDIQHGLTNLDSALPMLQAIGTTDTVALARVPWNEPGSIMKLLDAGCYGLICPMINTRAQCEAFVGACRYPPLGYRSFGPTRAKIALGDDYFETANNEVVALAMIETAEAYANLDEILSVPTLDGVYIGPSDLAISMGLPERSDYQSKEQVALLEKIVAACRQHNLVAGLHCDSAAYARRARTLGFQFVTVLSDSKLLAAMAQQTVAAVAGQAATAETSNSPY